MLTAIIAITLLALVLGLVLGFASMRFKVEGDPIVDQIDKILPQTQCGQCSFAGCRPYAEAIAAGEVDINRCPPGGETTIQALADLLEHMPRRPTHLICGMLNTKDVSGYLRPLARVVDSLTAVSIPGEAATLSADETAAFARGAGLDARTAPDVGTAIREIVAETGAKVDIDDEGVIKISSSNADEIEAARKWIEGIVEEAEVGKIYNGKVVNIVDFGAFVNFMGGKDGLVHVSEMKNERVEKPTDVVSEGQEVKVKVLEIDNRGKVRLSMRVVDQETGEELEDTRPPREPRGDRGPRGGGGGRGGDRRGGRGGPRRDRDGGGNKDGGGEAHVPDFLKD